MKFLFFGDLCITASNSESFCLGDKDKLFSSDLLELFKKSDFSCINLESPLFVEESNLIKKCGPTLGAKKECINGIASLNPSLVCLANNHIYDYGYSGLTNTTSELSKKSISFVGNVVDDKANPFFVYKDVAILNICENEFSYNFKDKSGACCLTNQTFVTIKQLKEKYNKVIVVFHGGTENFEYPSPNLVDLCHSFADLGADLVLCQHSHRIGCFEKYNQSTIVYGQGNFLFDAYSTDDKWTHGLGVIFDTENDEAEFVVTHFKDGKVSLASDSKKIIKDFYSRSNELKNNDYIKKYHHFCDSRYIKFLCKIRGYSKLRTGLEMYIFKGFFVKKHYSGRKKYVLYDLLNCEAHQELIKTELEQDVFDSTK